MRGMAATCGPPPTGGDTQTVLSHFNAGAIAARREGRHMNQLKTLGLAALAIMALTAMNGGTSAAAAEFHSTGGTNLTGAQVNAHVFSIEEAELICNVVRLNGIAAASGTSSTQIVHPEYENKNCTVFEQPAVINTTKCEFEFNANTNTVNLRGCTNGVIEIDVEGAWGHCHINIANQNGINGQKFSNMNTIPFRTLTEESSSTNIVANVTVSNLLCPFKAGVHNTASYTGLTGIMGATGETFLG